MDTFPIVGTDEDPYADPTGYWISLGQTSHADFMGGNALRHGHGANDPLSGAKPQHFRQEAALVEMLLGDNPRGKPFLPDMIFEAGCGRGRIAHLLDRIYPNARYFGIDVGRNQIVEAATLVPKGEFSVADITEQWFAERVELRNAVGQGIRVSRLGPPYFDLCVASEVLMHIRPGYELINAINNLIELTKVGGRIVTIDWVPLPGELEQLNRGRGVAYWNFPHDYGALFTGSAGFGQVRLVASRRTDRQMIFMLERV